VRKIAANKILLRLAHKCMQYVALDAGITISTIWISFVHIDRYVYCICLLLTGCIILGYRWFIGIAGMGLFTLKIKFSFGFKIYYLIRNSNTVYYYNENIVELP